MNAFFASNRLSEDENEDILKQHRTLYNGYRTMHPHVNNQQPLSFQDFAKIYGYNSIAEFLLAIKRGQSTLCMNNGNEYYLTKATSYPYKKYLEKFEIIIEMAKS